jgi:hypothetical protein
MGTVKEYRDTENLCCTKETRANKPYNNCCDHLCTKFF